LAHTENTALRKAQELKQTHWNKKGLWVSKDRSAILCQAPVRAGILILQSATKRIQMPWTQHLCPPFLASPVKEQSQQN